MAEVLVAESTLEWALSPLPAEIPGSRFPADFAFPTAASPEFAGSVLTLEAGCITEGFAAAGANDASGCAGPAVESAGLVAGAAGGIAAGVEGPLGKRITPVSGASMRRKTGAADLSPGSRGTTSDSAGPAAIATRSPSATTQPVRCQFIFAPSAGNSPQREL